MCFPALTCRGTGVGLPRIGTQRGVAHRVVGDADDRSSCCGWRRRADSRRGTTGTTICPVLSTGFANLQARIGGDPKKVRLVSITIDPGKDTPQAMKAYLQRYRAKANWDFLTGTKEEVERAMHGFNTFIPDTSSMVPLTFIYLRKERKWTRIFGVMSSSELLEECRQAGIPLPARP